MDKVLFEIKEENLETGLRGYPCGYCTTSNVDPEKGLFYAGHPIEELSLQSPEEVISLLYFGKEKSSEEKKAFLARIQEENSLSKETVEAIERIPRSGHPMKMLSAAMLILGMIEGKNDYEQDCLNVIGKMPHLVATVINHHAGWGKTPSPKKDLGYMENFFHMLNIPGEKDPGLYEALRLFNILHYDHGGGNLSAFVGKAVASGLEDLYGSLTGALCALAGPRHGKANQDALLFVQEILEEVGESGGEKDVEGALRLRLKEKRLIFGFGHAVLKVEDPRAGIQYSYAESHYKEHPLVKTALHLRSIGPKVLGENPKISCPFPNVDSISGSLLTAAGFGYPEYFTVLFGLSRCIGIAIQIVYERKKAKEGKGTPIVRPKYLYKEREI